MNLKCLQRHEAKELSSISTMVAVTIFAIVLAATSAAQTDSAVPAQTPDNTQPNAASSSNQASAPASQSTDTHNASTNLTFKAPSVPILKAGVPSAFNFCNGQAVPLPKGKFTDANGMQMDKALTPCGEQSTTTLNSVTGGNPPYSFQMDSGSFPPLGMHLGLNGLLYGTPAKPPLGGYKPFRVCAVDLSANSQCQEIKYGPAQQAGVHHGHAPLVIGALAAGGAAAIVGAKATSSSSSSSGGQETGTCNGTAPQNACGACTCTDGGTCNQPSAQCGGDYCTWAGPGSTVGQAPFCGGSAHID